MSREKKKELKQLLEHLKDEKRRLKLEAKREQEFLKGKLESNLMTLKNKNESLREEIIRLTAQFRMDGEQLERLRKSDDLKCVSYS